MPISPLGYEWEWWLTEALPGLAGIGTFALILFYARLYRQNKEQTRALKASYTPSLDTRLEYRDTDAVLFIHNRGQGAAKNITFQMEYQFEGRWTGLVLDINTTLPPNHVLEFNDRQKIRFIPIVYKPEGVQNEAIKLKEYMQDYDRIRFRHNITYTDVLEDKEHHQFLGDIGTSIEEGPLSETFEIALYNLPKQLGDQRYALFNPSPATVRDLINDKIWTIKKKINSRRPLIPIRLRAGPESWYELAIQEVIYADAVPYDPNSMEDREKREEQEIQDSETN